MFFSKLKYKLMRNAPFLSYKQLFIIISIVSVFLACYKAKRNHSIESNIQDNPYDICSLIDTQKIKLKADYRLFPCIRSAYPPSFKKANGAKYDPTGKILILSKKEQKKILIYLDFEKGIYENENGKYLLDSINSVFSSKKNFVSSDSERIPGAKILEFVEKESYGSKSFIGLYYPIEKYLLSVYVLDSKSIVTVHDLELIAEFIISYWKSGKGKNNESYRPPEPSDVSAVNIKVSTKKLKPGKTLKTGHDNNGNLVFKKLFTMGIEKSPDSPEITFKKGQKPIFDLSGDWVSNYSGDTGLESHKTYVEIKQSISVTKINDFLYKIATNYYEYLDKKNTIYSNSRYLEKKMKSESIMQVSGDLAIMYAKDYKILYMEVRNGRTRDELHLSPIRKITPQKPEITTEAYSIYKLFNNPKTLEPHYFYSLFSVDKNQFKITKFSDVKFNNPLRVANNGTPIFVRRNYSNYYKVPAEYASTAISRNSIEEVYFQGTDSMIWEKK